jgi:subtilisin family serine protease
MTGAVLLCAGSALAADPVARFRAYDGAQPASASGLAINRLDTPVKVVVVMSEPSVAGARALAPTRHLSDGERSGVVARVRAQHDGVRSQVRAQGATVQREFHSAVNGIQVEVKTSALNALAALPGVVRVLPVARHRLNNAVTVPYLGAPAVWAGVPGYKGEGVKVAVIDTGIDYTHANFGGPGTPAAFAAASASSTGPADPTLFGPSAPKVKGGIDLVGDAYTGYTAPVPDSNPLDCGGHGSHVAGTVAGYGVTGFGATYTGPYDAAAYAPGAFTIGPGVAPAADLYAVRVFGCSGSTDVVVEAIDWAVANDMDVISMSLGADFGTSDTADALAAQAAVAAGVVVVAASGNSGAAPYITSSPASGDGVLSVAAIDGRPSFPGAVVTLPGGATLSAQVSNGVALPSASLDTVVLRNADGSVSLGCSSAEYAGTAGKLVIALRGVCARIDRAIFGQAAGAAAVALINNGLGYGIFEGPIPGVSIPFLGVSPGDAAALTGAASVSLAPTTLPNRFLGTAASFSSGGPRVGDSALKPSLAGPGVSVFSTLIGSGTGGIFESGTSMATPHVAGVAALVTQAHPGWSAHDLSAAIAQTALPSRLPDYYARIEGSGLVQPIGATKTQAVVSVEEDRTATNLSFGFAEFSKDLRASRHLRVTNHGKRRATFKLTSEATSGDPHALRLSRSSITVGPGETESFQVSLSVPVGSVPDSATFNDIAGLVTLTPATGSDNSGVALTLPYYLVDRARSQLEAELTGALGPRSPTSTVTLTNEGGAQANADFYAWGLAGTRQGASPFDVRAIGVQTFPVSGSVNLLVFAVNTFDRFSSAATGEVDLYIDSDGDGWADYDVFSSDLNGDGNALVGVLNLRTGGLKVRFFTDAPTDGSTLLLPAYTSDLGLSPSRPRLTYWAYAWNWNGYFNAVPGAASFNAFSPAISNGDWVPVAPGTSARSAASIDATEWALTPALGLMVVNKENRAGAAQAALLGVRR